MLKCTGLLNRTTLSSSSSLPAFDSAAAATTRWKGTSQCGAAITTGRRFSTQGGRSPSNQVRMLLVGSPGSGKGTLSTLLCRTYPSITTISAGDLLRKHIDSGTDLGKRAKEIVQRGQLMDDQTMMSMVGAEVEERGSNNWLLDGFPRTKGQAQLLDESLAEQDRPLNLVVNLDVPEEVILGRILDRWVHPPSGRVYNLSYNPPKRAGLDDVTSEPLVQRSDDNEDTFRARLQSFHASTGPMIDHFARTSTHVDQGQLSDIRHAAQGGRVYVSLQGKTSAEIWPKLDQIIKRRFGGALA
ncbi:unnamed protein product [Jaminaea pallidilutea]